ncbi:MAG: hypothetical protein E6Q97_09115 [Desulfurellales bacterium]|nr:MAG: hypothetical protein E6Q97_09115 [Desulfurellales bacterium]
MAVYFVASGGSNTSPYDTWAKAATSLATALAAATSGSDSVIIQHDAVPAADAELSTDTTFTLPAGVSVIAASNDGGSAYTPTAMGAGNWIGNSTTNRGLIMSGGATAYLYGLTLRVSGTTSDDIVLAGGAGSDHTYEDCLIWQANSNSGADILLTSNTASAEHAVRLIGCTLRFGSTAQTLQVGTGLIHMENTTVSPLGQVPTTLLETMGAAKLRALGCDFSTATNLLGVQVSGSMLAILDRCRLPPTLAVAQTTYNNASQLEVFASDCSSGDINYEFMHFNNLGSLSVAVGGSEPYITSDGAEVDEGGTKAVWKIVTTGNASFANPYRTPWISRYNEQLSALSPYFECLIKGVATTFAESFVWSEWAIKTFTGAPKASIDVSDRGGVKASTTAQASSSLGAGDWTNEDGSANTYLKLGPASAITPNEVGDISGRVCVGFPSTTIYVDPQIRGL